MYLPSKIRFLSNESMTFLRISCLALMIVVILHYTKPFSTSSAAANSNYKYLVKVFDRSLAITQAGENFKATSNKNSPQLESDKLGFMVSYAPISSTPEFDAIAQKVAFTYDNAVAALAFMAVGDRERARQIVDTLVAAQKRDRYFQDGRIRNAYKGGRIDPKSNHFLLPSEFDEATNSWQESEFHVSTHTGNVAWAMLALLGYYESYGQEEYLAAAISWGEWIEHNCRDEQGAGGYVGGFTGWEERAKRLNYKSTEHNLDLYAAFARLYLITENPVWQQRANHAKQFVFAMWDRDAGKFWTGTEDDGATIYQEVIPLDAQAWTPLALKQAGKPYWRCLEYAEQHHQLAAGFDFNQDRDGVWYEGTAQMALAYQETNQPQKAQTVLAMLQAGKETSGGMPTSDRSTLTTGFIQPDGNPWLYFRSLHVGATAWAVLAEQGVNPFWLGSD